MMNLLQNEWIKIWNLKSFVVMIFLMILLNIGSDMLIEHNDIDNWEANALDLRETYAASLEESISSGVEEQYYKTFEEEIAVIDYSLAHNIPYGVSTAFHHMIRMCNALPLLLLLILFTVSKVFTKEYECNTWKNLLGTGIKRSRLYHAKMMFVVIYSAYYTLCYLLISASYGGLLYGYGDTFTAIKLINGNIVEINQLSELLNIYGLFFIKLIFYISLMIISILLARGKHTALIIPIALYLSNSYISAILDSATINFLLPFKYLAGESFSDWLEWGKMISGISVLGVYVIALYILGGIIFRKRIIY